MTAYSADALIDRYIKIRDDIAAISERHKAELKPHNEALEVLGTALQNLLNETGGDSIKTSAGTAYRSTVTSAKVDDWPSFISFVLERGDTELLVRQVNKTCYQQYLDSGEPVPGVSLSSLHRVNVRRS